MREPKYRREKESQPPRHLHDKIIYLLGLYPIISPSMLQSVLGPNTPPAEWRPVLNELVEEGTIILDAITSATPAGRHVTSKRLMLKETAEKLIAEEQ
jgi:hypothetical protein